MTDTKVDTALITEAGKQRLLTYLPMVTAPGASFGQEPSFDEKDGCVSMYPAILNDDAAGFCDACYEENFVQA